MKSRPFPCAPCRRVWRCVMSPRPSAAGWSAWRLGPARPRPRPVQRRPWPPPRFESLLVMAGRHKAPGYGPGPAASRLSTSGKPATLSSPIRLLQQFILERCCGKGRCGEGAAALGHYGLDAVVHEPTCRCEVRNTNSDMIVVTTAWSLEDTQLSVESDGRRSGGTRCLRLSRFGHVCEARCCKTRPGADSFEVPFLVCRGSASLARAITAHSAPLPPLPPSS